MQDFTNQTYKYGGNQYMFTAYLYADDPFSETGNYLNNEDIILFQYENSLNELYLKGELIFIDKMGIIDKYIEKQFVFCHIYHCEQQQKHDGNITITMDDSARCLSQNFFVSNIELLDRQKTQFSYKLTLLSINWLNCLGIIQYSNYNLKEPVELFQIIKSMLVYNNLTVNEETFDQIKSSVKLRYITHDNDNTLTSVRYLLNKLYYYQTTDSSLKFLVYNETQNVYQVFDLANTQLTNGSTNLTLSLFKNNFETLSQQEPTNLATITKTPKEKSFTYIFYKEIYDYDFNNNNFFNSNISSESILNYLNTRPTSVTDNYKNKYKIFNNQYTYKQNMTYWNNDLNIYDECSKILNEDNALVVAVDADILRKPGAYVLLNLDRNDVTFADSDDPSKLEEIKNRYKGFEGLWVIGKTRHIISPHAGRYKQNLVLFRNFIFERDNK